MKSDLEKRNLQFFMGLLFIVALIINLFFLKRAPSPVLPVEQLIVRTPYVQQLPSQPIQSPPPRDEAAIARRAAEAAAEQREKFIARYIDTNVSRRSGIKTYTVLAITANGNSARTVNSALAERLRGSNVEIVPSFFKRPFISDGLFNDTFNGSRSAIEKLDLADRLDGIVLARETVEYSNNPSLENVLTANLRLEIVLISLESGFQNQAWSFVANGAGFHRAEAESLAEERLMKQIAKDTKIALTQ